MLQDEASSFPYSLPLNGKVRSRRAGYVHIGEGPLSLQREVVPRAGEPTQAANSVNRRRNRMKYGAMDYAG